MYGEVEFTHDMVCNNPRCGEFVRKTGIGLLEGRQVSINRRVAVSKRACPVSKRNCCHISEEGEMMIEVTQESDDSSTVIKARDRRKLEAMEVKGHGEQRGVEWEGETKIVSWPNFAAIHVT